MSGHGRFLRIHGHQAERSFSLKAHYCAHQPTEEPPRVLKYNVELPAAWARCQGPLSLKRLYRSRACVSRAASARHKGAGRVRTRATTTIWHHALFWSASTPPRASTHRATRPSPSTTHLFASPECTSHVVSSSDHRSATCGVTGACERRGASVPGNVPNQEKVH